MRVFTNSSDDDYSDDYDDYTLDLNNTTNGTLQFVKKLINETRGSGQKIMLRCEIQNLDPSVNLTKIRVMWTKEYAPVQTEDKRVYVRRIEKPDSQMVISRLRILNLNIHDSGFYACTASNGKAKIRSESWLKVFRERWASTSSDLPKYEPVYPDTPSVNGDITTLLPNSERKEREDVLPTFSDSSATLEGRPSQVMFTKNTFEPPGQKSPQIMYNLNISEPFCQLYTGTRCRQFLKDKYVFIQPPFTQKGIEEKLENSFLVISHSNDLSANCAVFAEPSLCYSAFPICVDESRTNMDEQARFSRRAARVLSSSEPDPERRLSDLYRSVRNDVSLRRICRDDCELLENELCSVEYAIAKKHPVIGQTLSLEECESLPKKDEKYSNICLPLGIDRNVQEDEECYWGTGESYRGIYSASDEGEPCHQWSLQTLIRLSDYPELAGRHAYCRNPGGKESQPFCYINNKKELCNVPKCATYMWIYISVAFIISIGLSISAILFFCRIRNRNKQNTRSLQNMNVPTADKNIYGNSRINSPMELNPMLPQQSNNIPPLRNHNTNKNSFQNVPNYTYKEVSFVEELGEGAFGKVYKGELKTKSGKMWVAVKALKENASAKTQADFQREIDLISELKHPNIICLLGIIVKQEPMCMLFEFMSEGDLHEFLRANSPSEGKSLTQNEFLHIALQIALGMEYLSSNHYVHRDLAARNCLVSKELVVKISDFGLSRDMYSCDYYRVQSKSLLPVRWMPPESILYGKFTTESDVWSYGVVLWEIYSYGLQPYYGYNNQEVINMIRSRKLLPCPEHCPSYCYSLMVECWAELAVRRPSFPEICHRLRVWKQNGVHIQGAYFKNAEKTRTGHGSKTQTHQQQFDEPEPEPSLTWERRSCATLTESQSSLASRASSAGGRTQSTNLSGAEQRDPGNSANRSAERRARGERRKGKRGDEAKNTVVSANGDNVETTLTY